MSTPEPPGEPPPPAQQPTEPLRQPLAPRQPRAPLEPPRYEYVAEEMPPPASAWNSPWPALVTGVVMLLLGGLVGYLIGNSETGNSSAGARTVTSTATVERPKTVVQTHTVTASTVRETPSPVNQANEARLREAESNLRKLERENAELRRQSEEAGRSP